MYIKRTIESTILDISSQFPVLLISGPRQVGKTTVLKQLSEPNRTYVSLDIPSNLKLAKEEPELFFERFKPPLLIDEIQYAPELLPVIKVYVNERKINGEFWLTGSHQFHLMQNMSESLAGRVGIINLLGLSLEEHEKRPSTLPFLPSKEWLAERETLSALSLTEVYANIWRGGFPALSSLSINRDIFYGSYVQTYLQRDIKQLSNIGNTTTFLKFLQAVAARTGQLLNHADLSRSYVLSY
jgi:predicted AAA+ superfamily ATPase